MAVSHGARFSPVLISMTVWSGTGERWGRSSVYNENAPARASTPVKSSTAGRVCSRSTVRLSVCWACFALIGQWRSGSTGGGMRPWEKIAVGSVWTRWPPCWRSSTRWCFACWICTRWATSPANCVVSPLTLVRRLLGCFLLTTFEKPCVNIQCKFLSFNSQNPSAFQFIHHIAPDAHLISPLLYKAALAPSHCLCGWRSTQQEPEDDDVTHQ